MRWAVSGLALVAVRPVVAGVVLQVAGVAPGDRGRRTDQVVVQVGGRNGLQRGEQVALGGWLARFTPAWRLVVALPKMDGD